MKSATRYAYILAFAFCVFIGSTIFLYVLLAADMKNEVWQYIFHGWSVFFIYSVLSAVALASFYYLAKRIKQIFPRVNLGGLYMLGALIVYGAFICGFFIDESHRFFDVRRSYLYLIVCILASALLNLTLYFKIAKSEIQSGDSN